MQCMLMYVACLPLLQSLYYYTSKLLLCIIIFTQQTVSHLSLDVTVQSVFHSTTHVMALMTA